MTHLAITGASGTLGGALIQELKRLKKPFRSLTRHPKKSEDILFDYTDKTTFAKALKGIERLVLVAPSADRHLEAFLDAASALKQIVVISGISAYSRKDSSLALIEEAVYRKNIPYTTLRCNWFMQNFVTFWREGIVKEKKIVIPAGIAKTSLIDVRDIARCITCVLDDKKHLSAVYPLTGGEALSYAEVAHTISMVANMHVKYENGSDEGETQEMKLLFQEMRSGLTEEISPWVETLTGRAPISFFEFAKEHSKLWVS